MSRSYPLNTDNPLLDLSRLPRFARIDASKVESALDETLAKSRERIKVLETRAQSATWESLASKLQDIEEHLDRVWSPVSHLNAVKDSEDFRVAVDACLPKLSAFHTEIGQNLKLYSGYKKIASDAGFDGL